MAKCVYVNDPLFSKLCPSPSLPLSLCTVPNTPHVCVGYYYKGYSVWGVKEGFFGRSWNMCDRRGKEGNWEGKEM